MTKLLRFTIPSAVAALLGLATAPVQAAAVIQYNCGPGATFCTLPQLWAGGNITVDEDGDGTIDKTFNNWMRTGMWTPPNTLQVTAFGGPGLSAGLTFTTNDGWTVTSPATAFSNSFLFDVVTPPSLTLTNLTLELLQSNSTPNTIPGFGFTGVTVQANTAMVNNGGGATVPPIVTSPLSSLAPSPSMINVSVSGSVFGTSNGTANVRQFQVTFGQRFTIPEPGTVVGLLAAGGLGLAMKRRQKDS
ncbi:PEP-CTERM sorting domain-containing protein [Microcystis aeruginosa 11-30S32]|uniref:PEP-CTERM sorting domain-containing protein n=2 Tax=Microcystis aeruginosa TaxID=1126 RepID=A0A510PM50_MICAE|nr:PEP-CTERM sorting domain-containing protein [Microcystis aeruginosa 11-30S32]